MHEKLCLAQHLQPLSDKAMSLPALITSLWVQRKPTWSGVSVLHIQPLLQLRV